MNRSMWMVCVFLVVGGASASSAVAADALMDLKQNGAFGFPQAKGKVLNDTKDLRVTYVNSAQHLYVQAIIWEDGDDSLGKLEDGRQIGDSVTLVLDVDSDQKETPMVDRNYILNPWPESPGLRYDVVVNVGATTTLKNDSKGLGAIRYVSVGGNKKVRVDSIVIPLAEIGKKPGETMRFAYWARSPKPELWLNSVGFEPKKARHWSYELPRSKFHEVNLAKQGEALDLRKIPDGRRDPVNPVNLKK